MKICIFGATGLAGSGIVDSLRSDYNKNVIENFSLLTPTRQDVDLLKSGEVLNYLKFHTPDVVIMAAGKVGGIEYNNSNQILQYKTNHKINFNLIESCAENNITKLILLSSSCIYPKDAIAPIEENSLFKGLPEITNEGYSLAKEAAVRHLLMYRNKDFPSWQVLVPSNLYGYTKNYLKDDHVIPMLIKKFQKNQKQIEIWGDGSAVRQFLHHKDLGEAVKKILMSNINNPILNVAPVDSISIFELVKLLSNIFEFTGDVIYDKNKPNGHPDKRISNAVLKEAGWVSSINLRQGLINLVRESDLQKS